MGGGGSKKKTEVSLKKNPGNAFIRSVDRKGDYDPTTDLEAAETLPLAPRHEGHKSGMPEAPKVEKAGWLVDLVRQTKAAPEPAKIIKIDVNKACSYLKPRKMVSKPEVKPDVQRRIFHSKPPLSKTQVVRVISYGAFSRISDAPNYIDELEKAGNPQPYESGEVHKFVMKKQNRSASVLGRKMKIIKPQVKVNKQQVEIQREYERETQFADMDNESLVFYPPSRDSQNKEQPAVPMLSFGDLFSTHLPSQGAEWKTFANTMADGLPAGGWIKNQVAGKTNLSGPLSKSQLLKIQAERTSAKAGLDDSTIFQGVKAHANLVKEELAKRFNPEDAAVKERKRNANSQYILRNVALAKEPEPPKSGHVRRKRSKGRAEREWKWVGEHGIVARGRVSHKM